MDVVRATVCELPEDETRFQEAWSALRDHVRSQRSDLVLLPELPASAWIAYDEEVDGERWDRAVRRHDELEGRFADLAGAAVLGTRPILRGGRRCNEAFAWDGTYHAVRSKSTLPNERGWWEANWFHAASMHLAAADVKRTKVGFLICSEVMFNEWARRYGRETGAHIIAVPRAAGANDKWDVAVRMAGVAAGAYALSSNRRGRSAAEPEAVFGGRALVSDPEGRLLAATDEREPFVTVDLDLGAAEAAKRTYPRRVPDPRPPSEHARLPVSGADHALALADAPAPTQPPAG